MIDVVQRDYQEKENGQTGNLNFSTLLSLV